MPSPRYLIGINLLASGGCSVCEVLSTSWLEKLINCLSESKNSSKPNLAIVSSLSMKKSYNYRNHHSNPHYLHIQELFYVKFHKNLFSPFLLWTHYYGFHTRELKHATWNMWHAWVCSKHSISPLSSKNDLKKGTLDTLILNHFRDSFLFSKYNEKEHCEALFISSYIIAKKVSSSFRKASLNQKTYFKIALTSM